MIRGMLAISVLVVAEMVSRVIVVSVLNENAEHLIWI